MWSSLLRNVPCVALRRSLNCIRDSSTRAEGPALVTKDWMAQHLQWTRDHLTPELNLCLLTEECPLYKVQSDQVPGGLTDPWWSIYWPGGQVLARYVLDQPSLVKDKVVLDLGSGCGAVALSAAKAGAAKVLANDIDLNASIAVRVNAEGNGLIGVEVDTRDILMADNSEDLLGEVDVLLVGDMFYDEVVGGAVMELCQKFSRSKKGNAVYVGDPGRWFLENNTEVESQLLCMAVRDLGERCRRENYGFDRGLVWKFR